MGDMSKSNICGIAIALLAGWILTACGGGMANTPANSPSNQAAADNSAPAGNAPAVVPSKEDGYPYQMLKELAIVHLKFNSIEEALRLFDMAITRQLQQTNTHDAESWTGFGDALIKAGRKEEGARAYQLAIEIYKQAIKEGKQPENHNVLVNRVMAIYAAVGNEKEYKFWVNELRAADDNWRQQAELGSIHEQQKNFERAEACYKRAMELTAKDAAPHATVSLAYGVMLVKTDRSKEAEDLARAVVKSEGADDEQKRQARRLLFEIYDKRGELDKLDLK